MNAQNYTETSAKIMFFSGYQTTTTTTIENKLRYYQHVFFELTILEDSLRLLEL
jgi:hypothetical protein